MNRFVFIIIVCAISIGLLESCYLPLFYRDNPHDPENIVYVNGTVETIAGGPGTNSFTSPRGITIGTNGIGYVTDYHSVKSVTASGVVTVIAGSGTQGFANGLGAAASFYSPNGITIGSTGLLFIADTDNNAIRSVNPATGAVSTFAIGLSGPLDLVFAPDGNLLVTDISSSSIKTISPAGVVSTLKSFLSLYQQAYIPSSIAIDGEGVVYVSTYKQGETANFVYNTIFTFDYPNGDLTIYAGGVNTNYIEENTQRYFLNGQPRGLAVLPSGQVFFVLNSIGASEIKSRIYVDPGSWGITQVAGVGFGALNGAANTASFHNPWDLAYGPDGALYIADTENHAIRKINP